MKSAKVRRVGDVDDPAACAVRIVHISDTHLMHDSFVRENLIPNGDILVHSGDFDKYHISRVFFQESDYLSEIAAINAFFSGILDICMFIYNSYKCQLCICYIVIIIV